MNPHHDETIRANAAWWGSQVKGWLCLAAEPVEARFRWKSEDDCYERAIRAAVYAAHSANFVLPPYVDAQ